MAYVTPTDVATGDVLTAARWNQDVVANLLAGGPVFTTEAARNAAIPSPFEGQRAYITAPTEPAATGSTTILPSGIQTIYNGAGWVCVTEIGANTSAGGTTTSGSFTTTLSGSPGTNPSVTLSTGTSALVAVGAFVSGGAYVSCAVSGAGVVAANFELTTYSASTSISATRVFVLPGLTAGVNTFTMQYRSDGGTATIQWRSLAVKGIA